MTSIRKAFASLAIVLSSTATSSAFASEAQPSVRIRSFSHAGTACPFGSVTADGVRGAMSLKLWFEDVLADTSPGDPRGSRVNCQLILDLEHSSGWQYAVVGYRAEGEADLPRGASAQLRFREISSAGTTFNASQSFSGPIDGVVVAEKTLDPRSSALRWSPCGARRQLSLSFDVSVTSSRYAAISLPGTLGDFAMDPLPGPLEIKLAWKKCR